SFILLLPFSSNASASRRLSVLHEPAARRPLVDRLVSQEFGRPAGNGAGDDDPGADFVAAGARLGDLGMAVAPQRAAVIRPDMRDEFPVERLVDGAVLGLARPVRQPAGADQRDPAPTALGDAGDG